MGFAMIEQKGAKEAGAIFVIHRLANDNFDLYAPALQSSYSVTDGDDRCFEKRLTCVSTEDVRAFVQKEMRFDTDIWVVEIEISASAFHGLIQLADDK